MADIEINKSDIDEVNDVIQETDEEAYALDSEFTEEKEYKTVQKYELVTILSYLIGVRNEILDHMCSDEYVELLNSLRENKNARILRYLCKARTWYCSTVYLLCTFLWNYDRCRNVRQDHQCIDEESRK